MSSLLLHVDTSILATAEANTPYRKHSTVDMIGLCLFLIQAGNE